MVEQMAAILRAKEEWEAAEGRAISVNRAVNRWIKSGLAERFRAHYDEDELIICDSVADKLRLEDPNCRKCLTRIAKEYRDKHELVHLPNDVFDLFFRRKYVQRESSEDNSSSSDD